METFAGLWFDKENVESKTAADQCSCEFECSNYLKDFGAYDEKVLKRFLVGGLINIDREIRLLKVKHAAYLLNFLESLPGGFISLEASRPWIMYWIVHALYMLDQEPVALYPRIIDTLGYIQNPTGGFGGGRGHLSQGAPNYAAVLTLCTIATPEAWQVIDRKAMYRFFLQMKQPNGGFSIHHDGETDTRSTYTFISIARLLNILTDELVQGTTEFILQCQTYEGGFGGEPYNEAHGGYNFCAIAALLILGQAHRCDIHALESWLLRRQGKLEGGFQGRTNKLVDSCYSFWQGAALAIVEIIKQGGDDLYDMRKHFEEVAYTAAENDDVDDMGERVKPANELSGCQQFDQLALQRYILHCAQNTDNGGMRDKPSKSRDFYHSCYSLSGLSIAQRSITAEIKSPDEVSILGHVPDDLVGYENALERRYTGAEVYGDLNNLLKPTSVVYNIGLEQLKRSIDYFTSLPTGHQYLTQDR
ncbi:hypothetical protein EON65_08910 [archaeon]|nr:MAG: hypothetical protein EON65_08910 [archaeon]